MKILVGLLFLLSACSDTGETLGQTPKSAGGDAPTCTITASASPDPSKKTLVAEGNVACDASATIEIQVCAQWNPNGDFEDIMCQSEGGTGSVGTSGTLQETVSCGAVTAGRKYRTEVTVTVDGIDSPVKDSAEVSCE